MMMMLAIAIFLGAFAAAASAIALSVAPQWSRIVRLAAGHVEEAFAPLAFAYPERRISVRYSATGQVTVSRLRAAA